MLAIQYRIMILLMVYGLCPGWMDIQGLIVYTLLKLNTNINLCEYHIIMNIYQTGTSSTLYDIQIQIQILQIYFQYFQYCLIPAHPDYKPIQFIQYMRHKVNTLQKTVKPSNPSTLPNQYIDYKTQPQQFIKKITIPRDHNINPLYSAQSFHKYYDSPKQVKHTQLSEQFVRHKETNVKINKHILDFHKLQEDVRRVKKQYPSKKIYKKIDVFEEFIQKSQEHFINLNIDDGINPRNSFSREILRVQKYVQQLLSPPKKAKTRFRRVNKSLELKSKVHTQNIIDYLRKEKVQSRYFTIPKLQAEKEDRLSLQSWERTNRLLRSKSLYCQIKYQPPYLKIKKIDAEIMTQTRKYMSKLSKSKDLLKKTF